MGGDEWKSAVADPPALFQKVIRANTRKEGHPEWDNQCIDYLTEDCNNGEIKWSLDKRKPSINDYWTECPIPPVRSEM